jgi:hypothetical protein
MSRDTLIRRMGLWAALVTGLLFLGIASAQTLRFIPPFSPPGSLRGPPVNTRPNPASGTVTDPNTGAQIPYIVPAPVSEMPGKRPPAPLNNGSLLPEFVYDQLTTGTSGGGSFGGGGIGGGGIGGGGIGGGGIGGGIGGIGGGIGGIGGGGIGGFGGLGINPGAGFRLGQGQPMPAFQGGAGGGGFGGGFNVSNPAPFGFAGFGGNFSGMGGANGAQGNF